MKLILYFAKEYKFVFGTDSWDYELVINLALRIGIQFAIVSWQSLEVVI